MLNKFISVMMCLLFLLGIATQVRAADWLMLQGTEKTSAAAMKIWGFIQSQYMLTEGTKLRAGAWSGQDAAFNMIGPSLQSESQFQIRRARLGARGILPDSDINYFFLAEFGDNGITKSNMGSAKITDASVTLNYITGARIRVGLFKTPGSEDGLQAIHVHNYVNFTNVANQLLLERFFDGDGSDSSDPNKPNGSVGAFRDIGAQIFNTFTYNNHEFSYAVMVGNGNGIARGDDNGNKDIYGYLSTERIFGGNGPKRDGSKVFAWLQSGKRTLTKYGAGEYDRRRHGAGVTFRKDKYRATCEYIYADGMIINGTDGGAIAGSQNNAGDDVASFNIATDGKANGWYVDFGYFIMPDWSLDIRYDLLNRLTGSGPAERKFTTTTLGTQYFFHKKTRVTLNYEFRDAEAPNLPQSDNANQLLNSMDDRISVQLTMMF